MRHYFKGYYLKHQSSKKNGEKTLCLIVGKADREHFLQVITEDFSVKVPLKKGCFFSKSGVRICVKTPELNMSGWIKYGDFLPVKYDIMGPFQFFPMECRHGIISMYHKLDGRVRLNGETIDFNRGTGYIEMDSGWSFPSDYLWIQANDFDKKNCSIMAAAARIPVLGRHFRGFICAICYEGREYRLATYLGGKVILAVKDRVILKQGKYVLDIRVRNANPHVLYAPQEGEMIRRIKEAAACQAEFSLYEKGRRIFCLRSEKAGFEYETRKKM